MATPGGAETSALSQAYRFAAVEQLLRTEPWTFNFFQAVRLMVRIRTSSVPVGKFVHPSREAVRFGVNAATSFPASQIQELRWNGDSAPLMVVNFMGLTGPMGVLPLYYSELIRERLRLKDTTLLAFLNLFNHRMVSLFYQAWEKYRFTVAYERGERDRLSQRLLDFIGLGTKGLSARQAVADDSLLFYSGIFALHSRSGVALKNVIEDYFGVPAEIEQFIGAWRSLSRPDQCNLDRASVSEQISAGAVVGDEIWDQQSGARIRLGPLTLEQYIDFLPEGSAWEPLRALTRFFSGDEIDFEVQLLLRRDEVPACELKGEASPASAPQLGWTTWATTTPMGRDPGDTILRL